MYLLVVLFVSESQITILIFWRNFSWTIFFTYRKKINKGVRKWVPGHRPRPWDSSQPAPPPRWSSSPSCLPPTPILRVRDIFNHPATDPFPPGEVCFPLSRFHGPNLPSWPRQRPVKSESMVVLAFHGPQHSPQAILTGANSPHGEGFSPLLAPERLLNPP